MPKLEWSSIPGWFGFKDFYDFVFEKLPDCGKFVEVGVYFGRSIAYMANRVKNEKPTISIFGIDPFLASPEYRTFMPLKDGDSFYEDCMQNIFRAGMGDTIKIINMPSIRAARLFDEGTLDCVFIDGSHIAESVFSDISAWRPKVKPGGFLAGDDYESGFRGVMTSVDALLPERNLMGKAWFVQL